MINWYAVHVMSGRESRARDMLLNRAVSAKLWGDTILDLLIPTEKEFATKNGNRKVVDKKIFPGYIFVKMHLDKDSEHLVQSTDGVSGFVRSGGKAVPLTEMEVKNLLKSQEDVENQAPKSNFKINDTVLVINGVFSNFIGKVESVDEIKGKVRAYVNVFNRDTLVEMDINDIQLNL